MSKHKSRKNTAKKGYRRKFSRRLVLIARVEGMFKGHFENAQKELANFLWRDGCGRAIKDDSRIHALVEDTIAEWDGVPKNLEDQDER